MRGRNTSGRPALDTEPERSPAARRRSEAALVALLHELGDFDPPLIVLGGLVPDILTRGQDVRVAGLCGYLLAKSTAIRERGAEKDYYDFAYILIFNRLGGPAQAASELKDGKLKHRIQSMKTVWREVSDRFGAPERVGPKAYAVQALLVDPAEDEFRLRQDAVSAVGEFIETLGVL